MKEILHNPGEIDKLNSSELSDLLFQGYHELSNLNEKALIELRGEGRVIFVGDTHGDFKITSSVVLERFLGHEENTFLVFLGDYIDRTPRDLPWGSINNIAYLLLLKITYPDRVHLLKGNHETNNIIECYPYEFENDIERKFGLQYNLHEKFVQIFSVFPLMVKTKNGVFASHGGILKGAGLDDLRNLDKKGYNAVSSIVWSDPKDYGGYRGNVGDNFNEEELKEFLEKIGASVMIRGHDYNTLGFIIYDRRCLTIFSSRDYADKGNKGVLIAETNLDQDINDARDLSVKELKGSWVDYHPAVL